MHLRSKTLDYYLGNTIGAATEDCQNLQLFLPAGGWRRVFWVGSDFQNKYPQQELFLSSSLGWNEWTVCLPEELQIFAPANKKKTKTKRHCLVANYRERIWAICVYVLFLIHYFLLFIYTFPHWFISSRHLWQYFLAGLLFLSIWGQSL